ncbi:hypothetical protein T08_13981 [Trichinella sp. T8]|nr:hypothetical protein T08_13981 [Trichinella sp. T8]
MISNAYRLTRIRNCPACDVCSKIGVMILDEFMILKTESKLVNALWRSQLLANCSLFLRLEIQVSKIMFIEQPLLFDFVFRFGTPGGALLYARNFILPLFPTTCSIAFPNECPPALSFLFELNDMDDSLAITCTQLCLGHLKTMKL